MSTSLIKVPLSCGEIIYILLKILAIFSLFILYMKERLYLYVTAKRCGKITSLFFRVKETIIELFIFLDLTLLSFKIFQDKLLIIGFKSKKERAQKRLETFMSNSKNISVILL
jgi:hypothetical protein